MFPSAAFAGAFIDREVESKGLDFIDKEKAKRHGELLPRTHNRVSVLMHVPPAHERNIGAYDAAN